MIIYSRSIITIVKTRVAKMIWFLARITWPIGLQKSSQPGSICLKIMRTLQKSSHGTMMHTPEIMAMAEVVNWDAQLTTRMMAGCMRSRTSLVAAHAGHLQRIRQLKVPLPKRQASRLFTFLSSILLTARAVAHHMKGKIIALKDAQAVGWATHGISKRITVRSSSKTILMSREELALKVLADTIRAKWWATSVVIRRSFPSMIWRT